MYAIQLEVDPRLRTNSALRDYARMEYRNEEIGWILAAAANRKTVRRPWVPRVRIRRARPAARMVACKGSPRHSPSESPGLG